MGKHNDLISNDWTYDYMVKVTNLLDIDDMTGNKKL